MRRRISILIFWILNCTISVHGQALSARVNSNSVLVDDAHLFTDEQFRVIDSQIRLIETKLNYPVRIITLMDSSANDAMRKRISDDQLFENWFEEKQVKGVLIVLYNQGKSVYYKVGDEAAKVLTNQEMVSLTFTTLRYFTQKNDYFRAVLSFLNGFRNIITTVNSLPELHFSNTDHHLLLDHIFILTDDLLRDGDLLVKAGFTRSSKDAHHTGQGTHGNYFFFENIIVELLQISDSSEAAQNVSRIGFDFNQRKPGSLPSIASRFGFALNQIPFDTARIPFRTIRYGSNGYLKGPNYLQMAECNIDPVNPVVFVLSPAMRNPNSEVNNDKKKIHKNDDFTHANGVNKLTAIYLSVPGSSVNKCDSFNELKLLKNFEVNDSNVEKLILKFDNGTQKKILNLEKELNLIIEY